MIITHLRSSLLSGYEFCPHKCLLTYSLGMDDKPGLAAEKGSATHKALELLARQKLALQQGQTTFTDEELARTFPVEGFSPDEAVDLALAYYTHQDRTPNKWAPADKRHVRAWTHHVLTFNDGQYSPLQQDVLAPEQYFDLPITQPWGKYKHKVGEKVVEGVVHVRGTVDLIVRVGPGIIHYIDWKTGRRFDWNTNRTKEYADLLHDSQFRLYNWALHQLYPGEVVLFTVFYVQDGGPFTISFPEDDHLQFENDLRVMYERIVRDNNPRLVAPSRKCGWCWHNKPDENGNIPCQAVREELVSLGMEGLYRKRGKEVGYTGGGRTR